MRVVMPNMYEYWCGIASVCIYVVATLIIHNVVECFAYICQFTDLERVYVKKILANLDVVMGKEFGEEIRGIASYWNIDVGIVIGMNILPETRRVRSYMAAIYI